MPDPVPPCPPPPAPGRGRHARQGRPPRSRPAHAAIRAACTAAPALLVPAGVLTSQQALVRPCTDAACGAPAAPTLLLVLGGVGWLGATIACAVADAGRILDAEEAREARHGGPVPARP